MGMLTIPYGPGRVSTYRGHSNGTTESTANATVDTLGLAPCALVKAHEAVGLVPREVLRACMQHINIVIPSSTAQSASRSRIRWTYAS